MAEKQEVSAMEKLRKIARVLGVLATIGFWFMLVLGVLMLLIAALFAFVPARFFAGANTVEFGDLTLMLSPAFTSSLDGQTLKLPLILAALIAAVDLAVYCVGLHTVRRALRPIADGRPFIDEVATALLRLAWIVLIGGALSSLCTCIGSALLNSIYDYAAIFSGGNIIDYAISNHFDISFILPSLCLFLLHYIFKYGVELQRESDETL